MKRVYTCFCTDVIHEGHRNIIREAGKYGELTIGVLSDAAMIRFNRFPTISFEERMQLVKDIPEVSNVVVQDDVMYDKVIEELRPDYVIHGDNWQEGALKAIRDNVEGLLKTYGGEIIDVPYTYNEEDAKEFITTTDTLIRNNYNIVRSSKELFVHKNTLMYRLTKIKNEFDIDPINSESDRSFIKIYNYYLKHKIETKGDSNDERN